MSAGVHFKVRLLLRFSLRETALTGSGRDGGCRDDAPLARCFISAAALDGDNDNCNVRLQLAVYFCSSPSNWIR
jgi:hypothetical protein